MTETATEITAAGYSNIDIGAHCAAWAYIEFVDDEDAKLIRISKSDTRVTQTSVDTKKVVYSVALTGADTDIAALTLPQTFAGAKFKNTDSDSADVLASDTFTAATLSASGDTLTITISAGVLT